MRRHELGHAASVFGISRGKSAVQNIDLGRPYDQLVGFQRCRFTLHIMLQLETTVMEKAMLLRRQNSPWASWRRCRCQHCPPDAFDNCPVKGSHAGKRKLPSIQRLLYG